MNKIEKDGTIAIELLLSRQARLAEFAKQSVRSFANTNDLFKQAVAQITSALNVRFVKVLKYRPEQADLLIVEGSGWREGVVETLPCRST
jgi:hypothetical protein